MKSKIKSLTGLMISLFLILSMNTKGTGINVSGAGKIIGNIYCITTKSPLVSATITLYLSSDSTMIAGTISDYKGHFYFSMLEPGNYYLVVSEASFENKQINVPEVKAGESKINLDEIIMRPALTAKKKRNKLFKI